MNLMVTIALIASGGASGALARAGVGWFFAERLGVGPLGTLTANLVGCMLFGAARAAVDHFDWGSDGARLFVFTGFLGAFTTFSTFEADLFNLWNDGMSLWASLYLAASVIGGMACFAAGYFVVSRMRA